MTPTAAVTEIAETGSRTDQDRESVLLDRVPGGLFRGSPWVVASTVGIGAAALVVLGRFEPLSATPAGFLGFAATFGFFSTPGADMFAPLGISHPLVATLAALVLGGLFGLLSSIVGAALTRTSVPEVS